MLLAFVVGDYFMYWEHRIMHMVPVLRKHVHSWHHAYHVRRFSFSFFFFFSLLFYFRALLAPRPSRASFFCLFFLFLVLHF